MNTGFLRSRIFTVLSLKFDVILPAALLVVVVARHDRHAIFAMLSKLLRGDRGMALRNLANHDATWLLALLIGGTTFEKQNTGSHELILLWPAIVLLLRRYPLPWTAPAIPVVALAAVVTIPTPVAVVHRAARVVASMPKYLPVEAPLLGPIARVSAKPEVMLQARAFLANYVDNRAGFERLANRNVLPSYIVFSEIDFYVNWMVSTQAAAEALLRYEAEAKVRFEKIMTLDFVDTLPFMLKRTPLRGVAIGNDPDRTLAKPDAAIHAEIESADALLVPLCPPTNARNSIFLAYTRELGPRKVVALTPCFNMFVKP